MNSLTENWSVFVTVGSILLFILSEVVKYSKLKDQIDGVGRKVNSVINTQYSQGERLAKIEGFLEGKGK